MVVVVDEVLDHTDVSLEASLMNGSGHDSNETSI